MNNFGIRKRRTGRKSRKSCKSRKSRKSKSNNINIIKKLKLTKGIDVVSFNGGYDIIDSFDKRKQKYLKVKTDLYKKLYVLKKLGKIKSLKFSNSISKHYDGSSIYYPNRKHVVYTITL